jgi:hypothetical protein
MEAMGPKIADGRTAEVFAWGEGQVLKLYRPDWRRGAVDFEYRQALASQQTGYRVPKVDRVVEVDGRYGIIYERVEGETMLHSLLRNLLRFPAYAHQMADMHADMHRRDASGLEPVRERLAGKIQAVDALSPEEKYTIQAELFRLPEETKLLHGDFHPDNILLTYRGPMIIDWIDATLGHPLADVARTWVIGNYGVPPEEKVGRVLFKIMIRIYLRRYFHQSPYTRAGLQDWLLPVAAGRLSENIPHEKEALLDFVRKRLAPAT